MSDIGHIVYCSNQESEPCHYFLFQLKRGDQQGNGQLNVTSALPMHADGAR